MKEAYKVQYMTNEDYCKMCEGCVDYEVYDGIIEAETPEEAYTKAKVTFKGYVINEHIITVAQYEAKQKKIENQRNERIKKEAEKKTKKEAREKAKREALNMTEEEYKAYTKNQQKVKRYEREIKKMQEEIAKMQKEIEYKKNWIEKNK